MSQGAGTPREPSDALIRRVLRDCEVWAVVGLSTNASRAAYGVARFLQQHGKQVVPVHPSAQTVHGEKGYATLEEIPFGVDCVDTFVRSELAGPIADQAISIAASAVWFQLGVIDLAAAKRVRDAGLDMVMDRCPAIEWPRLGPAA